MAAPLLLLLLLALLLLLGVVKEVQQEGLAVMHLVWWRPGSVKHTKSNRHSVASLALAFEIRSQEGGHA
jgi:hypothetical protein